MTHEVARAAAPAPDEARAPAQPDTPYPEEQQLVAAVVRKDRKASESDS